MCGIPESFDRINVLILFQSNIHGRHCRMTYNHIPKSLELVELFRASVAEGFEALTMNAVKHMMEPKGFGEDLPPFMQMVEWHFVEELEHRTVTFDVYEHVFGDYLYHLFVGVCAQWHFSNWMRRVAAYMLEVRPQQSNAGSLFFVC